VKWCLHKDTFWCRTHKRWHLTPFIDITTYGDGNKGVYLCNLCSGRKWQYPCKPDPNHWVPECTG
jgi:hypothetical protein